MREVRATAVGAAILLLYILAVLVTGRVDLGQYATLLLTYAAGAAVLWIAAGIACMSVQILVAAKRSGSEPFLAAAVLAALRGRWQRDRGLSLLWPPLLFATLIASYNSFKQSLLPLVGFRFDHAFAQTDRLFFFGHDGWQVTHALFSSPAATIAIDRLYHTWFLPMALGIIVCAWLPASTYRLRTQYLLSYLGVWIVLGSVAALLLPAAGPCFVGALVGPAPAFDPLLATLAQAQAVKGAPLLALQNQTMLLHAHAGDQLNLGAGISAMPSIHNALAVLFALAGRRVHKWLGVVLWAYAGAIFVGSVHLGWHYAVDGMAAAVLTIWIWRLCGRVADRLEQPLLRAHAAPAIA